jgi:hypothetical protein
MLIMSLRFAASPPRVAQPYRSTIPKTIAAQRCIEVAVSMDITQTISRAPARRAARPQAWTWPTPVRAAMP